MIPKSLHISARFDPQPKHKLKGVCIDASVSRILILEAVGLGERAFGRDIWPLINRYGQFTGDISSQTKSRMDKSSQGQNIVRTNHRRDKTSQTKGCNVLLYNISVHHPLILQEVMIKVKKNDSLITRGVSRAAEPPPPLILSKKIQPPPPPRPKQFSAVAAENQKVSSRRRRQREKN